METYREDGLVQVNVLYSPEQIATLRAAATVLNCDICQFVAMTALNQALNVEEEIARQSDGAPSSFMDFVETAIPKKQDSESAMLGSTVLLDVDFDRVTLVQSA